MLPPGKTVVDDPSYFSINEIRRKVKKRPDGTIDTKSLWDILNPIMTFVA